METMEMSLDTDLTILDQRELSDFELFCKDQGDKYKGLMNAWYGKWSQTSSFRGATINPTNPLNPADIGAAHGSQFVSDLMRGYGRGPLNSTKEL
jgi:hypothetical protein